MKLNNDRIDGPGENEALWGVVERGRATGSQSESGFRDELCKLSNEELYKVLSAFDGEVALFINPDMQALYVGMTGYENGWVDVVCITIERGREECYRVRSNLEEFAKLLAFLLSDAPSNSGFAPHGIPFIAIGILMERGAWDGKRGRLKLPPRVDWESAVSKRSVQSLIKTYGRRRN